MRFYQPIVALLILLATNTYAQNYALLATDPAGDAINGIQDIKSFSFRMDASNDSIWFKIEMFNPVAPGSPDIGFMLGIDTNLNITDGTKWLSGTTLMQYDHALFVVQTATPPYAAASIGIPAQNTPVAVSLSRPDNYTYIINTRLSMLDNDSNFNIVLGAGAPDIINSGYAEDDAPDADYVTISVIHKDLSTTLVYPYSNQTVVSNEPFLLQARIKNEGDEPIEANNIIRRTITVAGQTFIDSPAHPYLAKGDTYDLQLPAFSVNLIKDETADICIDMRVLGFTDPNGADNKDCKTVKLRMFPAGITGIQLADHLLVSYTPTIDCISIKGNTTEKILKLYSLSGQVILQTHLADGENKIPVSTLPAGVYFYSILDTTYAGNRGKLFICR